MVRNIYSVFSYTLLLTLQFPIKFVRSHDINLALMCESEIVLFNSTSDSKIDAAVDDAYNVYSNIFPPPVNLTLNGSNFSGK